MGAVASCVLLLLRLLNSHSKGTIYGKLATLLLLFLGLDVPVSNARQGCLVTNNKKDRYEQGFCCDGYEDGIFGGSIVHGQPVQQQAGAGGVQDDVGIPVGGSIDDSFDYR